jgi:hypothetical protein
LAWKQPAKEDYEVFKDQSTFSERFEVKDLFWRDKFFLGLKGIICFLHFGEWQL